MHWQRSYVVVHNFPRDLLFFDVFEAQIKMWVEGLQSGVCMFTKGLVSEYADAREVKHAANNGHIRKICFKRVSKSPHASWKARFCLLSAGNNHSPSTHPKHFLIKCSLAGRLVLFHQWKIEILFTWWNPRAHI